MSPLNAVPLVAMCFVAMCLAVPPFGMRSIGMLPPVVSFPAVNLRFVAGGWVVASRVSMLALLAVWGVGRATVVRFFPMSLILVGISRFAVRWVV